MAVLNKLFFTKKKVNITDDHILQENVRSVCITKEQVRLLLFKECDWKGRQVVFDSSVVEQVPLDGADISKNFNPAYETKYGKPNTGQTNNCFVYKFKSIPADANSLGDMIFGAVAMNYGGTSLKIHILNEPKRLMCTKVFAIPSHKTALTNRKTSKVAVNEENCSRSASSTKPLDVPNSGEDLSLSFSLGRGDSGYCGDRSMASSISSLYDISSDLWSRDENYHDDLYSFKTPSNGRKLSTSSNGSWHRRVMRNISTRLDVSGQNSNHLNIPSATMSRNSSTNSDSQMAGGSTTDSLSSTTSQSSHTRLGLALVFTLADSDTLRYCLEHCQQLESLVCRLRHAVLLGGARCEALVHITDLATQWLDELINGPRLHPIWHSLVSEKRETREMIAEHFLDSICSLLDSSDTKHTNFFISTLVTTVLTYHLGWVSTVSPYEPAYTPILKPYGALWAQLGDLRGAPPAPAARTLICGRSELVSRLLHALTYFIRCGRVTRLTRHGNVFKDCAEQIRNNVIKAEDQVTNLNDCSTKPSKIDLGSTNSDSFPFCHDGKSSNVLMNDVHDQTFDNEIEDCEVHYVVNSTTKVIRTTNKYLAKSCTGRCDSEIKKTCAKSIPSVLAPDKNVKSCSNLLSTCEKSSNKIHVSTDSCTPVLRRDLYESGTSSYLCESKVDVTKSFPCNGLKKSSTFITKLPCGISEMSSEESDRDSDQTFTEPKRSRKTSVFYIPNKSLNPVNGQDDTVLNTWIPQPLVPEQLDTTSSEVSYSNLKTTLKRKPTVLTALNNYSDEDSNGSIETESNLSSENEKGVLFVLGDDEKLVGLKNKCADRKFVKRSSRSEEIDIDVTRTKENVDSKKISVTLSAATATQDEKSKTNAIETKNNSCEIEVDTKMEVSELKCCRNQQLQHSKPIKHSGVKFEFEKFPQIVINYMKSKNLEILDSDYIGKPGNLKLDGYKFDPSSVFPDIKERCENCQQCQMAESVLQTPSNASELEFTSDMPARTFAEEKIEVPVVMPPKSFVRRKKEKTVVINPASVKEKNCDVQNVKNDNATLRTEMPLYSGQDSNDNSVECGVGFDQTLLRGVTDHYVPDVILQGTTMSVHQFEPHMRRDLELSTYVNRIFDNADRQALAVVADTEKWTVRVWSSKGPLNGLGSMSTLVGNMLDVLPHLRNARVPTNECILYMESKLRDFCILSKTMSDILMTTDFCDMATLTKALNIDANDVPLLLAVATTHTPQVASRYGVSYR